MTVRFQILKSLVPKTLATQSVRAIFLHL
uniref:Uncharacterized protein n=1 Tax=Anguilla anguilla TaxID=7936 RepID=A0A0E9PHA2_ANGAN